MTIKDLALKIKEENLTKDMLEKYNIELTSLYAEMELNLAEIEKKEAIYLNDSEEKTRNGAERKWYAMPEGQEQITLKHNIRALSKLLSSIKHRLYQAY